MVRHPLEVVSDYWDMYSHGRNGTGASSPRFHSRWRKLGIFIKFSIFNVTSTYRERLSENITLCLHKSACGAVVLPWVAQSASISRDSCIIIKIRDRIQYKGIGWTPWEFPQIVGSLWLPFLTHWGRVTHICIGNLTFIGSDNALSLGRCQAIIWTNVGLLSIGPLQTNFSEISIVIHAFSFKKMRWKMAAILSRPQCVNSLLPRPRWKEHCTVHYHPKSIF